MKTVAKKPTAKRPTASKKTASKDTFEVVAIMKPVYAVTGKVVDQPSTTEGQTYKAVLVRDAEKREFHVACNFEVRAGSRLYHVIKRATSKDAKTFKALEFCTPELDAQWKAKEETRKTNEAFDIIMQRKALRTKLFNEGFSAEEIAEAISELYG